MHDPNWSTNAQDYSQQARNTRPQPVPGYSAPLNQPQNNNSFENGFRFTGMPYSGNTYGTSPNGFASQQPQFSANGHSFSTRSGMALNGASATNFSNGYQLPQSSAFTQPGIGHAPSQGHYQNSPPTFSPPQSATMSPPFLSTSPQNMFSTDPSVSGSQQPQSPPYLSAPRHSMSSDASPSNKRRIIEADSGDDGKDDDAEIEKTKPQGACGRCKGLKVKCEFRTDIDPCRRCLNAGAVCEVPGRKKRRTPPKREHLLNQIREQAAQIENLMAQLEKVHQTHSSPLIYSNFDQDGHSPNISPSTMQSPASSYFGPQLVAPETTSFDHNRDIEEWISKARVSLAEFGGIISGMKTQKLVADQEDSGSDDGFYTGEEEPSENFPIRIENSDGEEELSQVPPSDEATKNAALPSTHSALGMFASMAIHVQDEGAEGANNAGPASTSYFRGKSLRESPAPEGITTRDMNAAQIQAPQILKRGIVTTSQVDQLFKIYFDYMNLSLSLLDPVLYTPQATFCRSPFLFTTICAIASRHLPDSQALYPQAMHYAQVAAAEALIGGVKNVEMASAYMLLSLFPVPARRWEDDRSWLYLGLAIRVATDLNLQKPPAKAVNEAHAREMLNRTRVWLNCFNLDRSTGSQHGKQPIIRDTDYMACHSEDWWRQSQHNMQNFDIHICGYTAELRLMSQFVGKIHNNPEHPKGFNKDTDWERLAAETDDEVFRLGEKWFAITGLSKDPQSEFRTALLKLAYSYARLAILSYAFQHAVSKNKFTEESFPILARCLRAATDVVNSYLQNVAKPNQLIFLRHGPEAQSVFITFASAFLVKLLHPKFVRHVSGEQRREIRALVERVVAVLGSPQVAIDDRHAPKLYSQFLQGLLNTPMAVVDISSPTSFNNALPRSRSRKSRNGSKNSGLDQGDYMTSASSNASMSSPPANFSMSNGGNSFNQMPTRSHHVATNQSTPEMPPVAFDNDFLASMQQSTDPYLWDVYSTLPGMQFMSQLQNDPIADSLIFDTTQYSVPFMPTTTNGFQ